MYTVSLLHNIGVHCTPRKHFVKILILNAFLTTLLLSYILENMRSVEGRFTRKY